MPDRKPSPDQPDPCGSEAVFGTRHPTDPKTPRQRHTSSAANGSPSAQLRQDEAEASITEAEARAAHSQADISAAQAAAEPFHQLIDLLERAVALLIEVLKYAMLAFVTLVIVAIQVAGFVIDPWFFAANLLLVCLSPWAARLKGGDGKTRESEERKRAP